MSGSLSNRVFALLCETTLFLTRRSLRDDYQSPDTNPADLKLLFNVMSKQVLNLNHCEVRDQVFK